MQNAPRLQGNVRSCIVEGGGSWRANEEVPLRRACRYRGNTGSDRAVSLVASAWIKNMVFLDTRHYLHFHYGSLSFNFPDSG